MRQSTKASKKSVRSVHATRIFKPPTVARRVDKILRGLALVRLAVRHDPDDQDGGEVRLDREEADALEALILHLHDQAYWLSRLDESTLDTSAPTDDERDLLASLAGVR